MKIHVLVDYERCKVLGAFTTSEEAGIVKSLQKIPVHCHIEEAELNKECRCKK